MRVARGMDARAWMNCCIRCSLSLSYSKRVDGNIRKKKPKPMNITEFEIGYSNAALIKSRAMMS